MLTRLKLDRMEVWNQIWDQVGDHAQIGDPIWYPVRNQVWFPFKYPIFHQLSQDIKC